MRINRGGHWTLSIVMCKAWCDVKLDAQGITPSPNELWHRSSFTPSFNCLPNTEKCTHSCYPFYFLDHFGCKIGSLTRYLIKLFRLLTLKWVFFPYLECGHSRWIKWENSKCFFSKRECTFWVLKLVVYAISHTPHFWCWIIKLLQHKKRQETSGREATAPSKH